MSDASAHAYARTSGLEGHRSVRYRSPNASGRAKVAEGIIRTGELGDAWLELQTLIARPVRPEKDGAALQVTDFMDRVVGKEVAGIVIGYRHRQPVYPCSLLDVPEDRIESLVVKVGGKREHRCLHGARLYTRRQGDQAWRPRSRPLPTPN